MRRDTLSRTALITLLGLACLYTYRYETPETRSWPAAGIAGIVASSANGHIDATGVQDTTITAVITRFAYGRNRSDAERAAGNVTVTDTIAGSQLRLDAVMPMLGARPYGAFYVITCPDSMALSLSTTNGGVNVTRIHGPVTATTTNGAFQLANTRGAALLSTTNGAIDISGHSGAVEAGTTNGAVNCDIAELDPAEDVTVTTTNAAILLFLPADVSATVDARNSNAPISFLDFSYVYDDSTSDHRKHAVIGSGTSTITLRTTNAEIRVRRR